MKRGSLPKSSIKPILSKKRIIVCVGAGGVGKTTLAASIAVRSARAGRRVTCLTIDPARRLADSLGVTSGSPKEKTKDITEILGQEMEPGGRLSFGMLDPKETFAEIVRMRASSPRAAERILKNKLYRYVSGSLSGMHEYMALERLQAVRIDPDVQLIVLDTPPTTNAIDFFTAPRRMTEALNGRLVGIMRRAYGGATRTGFDFLGRWASAVLRVLSQFTGIELLNEIMAFVDALSDLFGSFSDRAKSVEKVLHGDDVAFCLVATPDKATLRETRDFHDRLSGLGLAVDAVVFNRAHWPRAEDPPKDLDEKTREKILEINSSWNQAHDFEQEIVMRVRKAWEGLGAVIVVPQIPQGANRVESLDQLGEYL
jgi:anion-transporting  ArsA/GET3 family ATPase